MRRGGEHGGITPLMVGLIMVLLTILVGASAVGRLAMLRQDAQRGADAACQLAGNAIRLDGLPLKEQEERQVVDIALRNMAPGSSIDILVTDEKDQVSIKCLATLNVGVPWGAELVSARASSAAPHTKYDDTKRILPRVVFVLDYSGSMQTAMVGDSASRPAVDVLKAAMRRILEEGMNVQIGAVLFSYANALDTVSIGFGTEAQVASKVSGRGAEGITATQAALDKANALLGASPKIDPDQASFVLLISDGEPSDDNDNPIAAAQAAAARLRNGESLVEILTLHIENQTGERAAVLRDFMLSISGTNETVGTPAGEENYFRASSEAELNDLLIKLKGILACPVKLEALPAPGEPLIAFVRSPAGDEVRMTNIKDLMPDAKRWMLNDEDPDPDPPHPKFYNMNAFWLEESNKTLYVSKLVCNKMLEADHEVVVRTGRPRLTE